MSITCPAISICAPVCTVCEMPKGVSSVFHTFHVSLIPDLESTSKTWVNDSDCGTCVLVPFTELKTVIGSSCTDFVEVMVIPSSSELTLTLQTASLTSRFVHSPLTKPVATALTDGTTVSPLKPFSLIE